MKTKLMTLMLVAGGTLLAETHIAVGVRIGAPRHYVPAPMAPAPVAVVVHRPPCPGPGYVWIDGYYDEFGYWIGGYWAVPPYAGAYWVAPRRVAGRYYAGYWGGARYVGHPAPHYVAPRVSVRPEPVRGPEALRGREPARGREAFRPHDTGRGPRR